MPGTSLSVRPDAPKTKEADIAIQDSGITPPSSPALPMAWAWSHHTQKYLSEQGLENN